jgi:hypothetical protein
MTVALARRLVWEGVVAPEEANAALHAHATRRIAFLRALVESHPELIERLDAELSPGTPSSTRALVPDPEILARLPAGLCSALLALPIGRDPMTAAVRVAVADASDTHVAAEIQFHLRAPVELVPVSLSAVLVALGHRSAPADSRSGRTPAFGTQLLMPASSSRAAGSEPLPSSMQPSHAAAGPPRSETPAEPIELRPSAPPIPLVRVSPEAARPPATVKGVAPQAKGSSGFAAPVVVPPRSPAAAVEPVISLTRPKSLAPPAKSAPNAEVPSSPVSSGPSTARMPTSADGQALAQVPAPDPEQALRDLAEAESPDDVARALTEGLTAVAQKVVVLAVRGKVYEGREASDPATRALVRSLVVSGDRPSALLTAVQTGSYLGPIPQTPVHAELSRLLGDPEGEIAVGSVAISGRVALLYVLSGLETAYLATRRSAELGQAAGRALERIVRERKK